MVVVVDSLPTTLPNRHSFVVPLRTARHRSNAAAATTRTRRHKRVDIRRNGGLPSDDALATTRTHNRRRADTRRNGVRLAANVLMAKRETENCPLVVSAEVGHPSP